MLEIRSPKYEQASIQIPAEASRLERSFNGIITSKKGDEYVIKNNIIDLLPGGVEHISLAQQTNKWTITASLYEDTWRKNALSILSNESFPLEKEMELLHGWMPADEGTYIDVGCSSGLYARALKKSISKGNIVAIDFSTPMLQQARKKAAAEHLDLYLLKADAREMPFYANTFDGGAMGGTLNELSDPLKVLYECRRVIKPGGVLFMMHLLKSSEWYKRALQYGAKWSGLLFWNLQESNDLFKKAGFRVDRQQSHKMVCFSRLIAE